MNRNDLKALARTRLREAKALLASGHFSGAYYLAGYVVECALKACIAKETRRHDFPDKKRALDSWQHSPPKLVDTARLRTLLEAERRADPRFAANWNVIEGWTEESRYNPSDRRKAEALIRAISDKDHGVLRWLRRHW